MSSNRKQFDLLGKTVLGRIIFTPPFKANSALYDEARFVHVVNGNSRLYVPNNTLDIRTSDSFLMKTESFVNHWQENEEDTPNEVIIIQFYPEVLKYIYDYKVPDLFSSKLDIQTDPVEKIGLNPMIHNYFESLRYYFDHPELVTDELLKLKIKELVLVMLNSDRSGRIKSILSGLFQSNEYEFKEIIHSHLFEDLKIQDLAFFAGQSLSSFKRKFKTVFGTSPTQYIRTKRLEKAENLLITTNERISDIAYDCGFNDIAYFSKTFSALYNSSPSQYRKNHLKG